ncbi:MAG: hypothetical protein AB1349_13550, partial [Elusimicrobiota bacterium]
NRKKKEKSMIGKLRDCSDDEIKVLRVFLERWLYKNPSAVLELLGNKIIRDKNHIIDLMLELMDKDFLMLKINDSEKDATCWSLLIRDIATGQWVETGFEVEGES